MSRVPELTEGAIAIIMNGGNIDNPILQVLSLKKMSGGGEQSKERYRCYLSDGKFSISFAMMNGNVFYKYDSNGLPRFSVIKVIKYITTVINNTGAKDSRVLLVLDMEVLVNGDELNEKIGNPVNYADPALPNSNGTTRAASAEPVEQPPDKRPRMENDSISNGHSSKMENIPTLNDSSTSMNVTLSGPGQITHPITSLSPYHTKWVIKARVSNKSNLRTWSNSKTNGKLFSVDLVDESGEIRMTFFNAHVDKFYDMLQIDKVYYMSKAQLKPANKQFNSIKNDYEITCHNDTIIEECPDEDAGPIPQTKYDFTAIEKIQNIESNTYVDVIGIVKSTSDLQSFTAKTSGKELIKRDVVLVDKSNKAINLTLWNTDAENFDGSSNPVVVIKGAKVGEYSGGKNISTGPGSIMKINPEMPESYQLKGWFDSEGNKMDITNISASTGGGGSFNTPWCSFKEITDMGLGQSDKGDYYINKATLLLIRSENCMYKSCPVEECNKKVTDMNTGMYRCEKCNREFPNFKWRYLCSMNVGDYSGNQWVNLFNAEAEKVIGQPAHELGDLVESKSQKLTEILSRRHFTQYILKCRAKVENYNDEARLKTIVVKVDPLNHEEYNNHLCSVISQHLEA